MKRTQDQGVDFPWKRHCQGCNEEHSRSNNGLVLLVMESLKKECWQWSIKDHVASEKEQRGMSDVLQRILRVVRHNVNNLQPVYWALQKCHSKPPFQVRAVRRAGGCLISAMDGRVYGLLESVDGWSGNLCMILWALKVMVDDTTPNWKVKEPKSPWKCRTKLCWRILGLCHSLVFFFFLSYILDSSLTDFGVLKVL